MRIKKHKVIITFPTTTAAMAMEKACMEQSVPGRLIPVPREITAGCGMAWSVPPEGWEAAVAAAEKAGVKMEGIFELEI